MYFVGEASWGCNLKKQWANQKNWVGLLKGEISQFLKRLTNRLCFYYIIGILQQNLILFNSRLQFVFRMGQTPGALKY